MKVTLWLSVTPGENGLYGRSQLWTREITTGFLPSNGDGVYCWVDDGENGDGPTSGPRLSARNRYMDANGEWNVELQRIVVEPPPAVQELIRASRANDWIGWYSDSDGPFTDAEAKLAASGWHPTQR